MYEWLVRSLPSRSHCLSSLYPHPVVTALSTSALAQWSRFAALHTGFRTMLKQELKQELEPIQRQLAEAISHTVQASQISQTQLTSLRAALGVLLVPTTSDNTHDALDKLVSQSQKKTHKFW